MDKINLTKIEIIKENGSKKVMDLLPDSELTMGVAEKAKLVTDDNLVALVKLPGDGPLVVVLENEEGQQHIIKIKNFSSPQNEGEESPQVTIIANNIEGVWAPPDFETTPTVVFSSDNSQIDIQDFYSSNDVDALFLGEDDEGISREEDLIFVSDGTDVMPVVSISNSGAVPEGSEAVFKVSLSTVSSKDVTVELEASDGAAIAGEDYTSPEPGVSTVIIPAGQLSVDVRVRTIDDDIDEFPEDFYVNLVSADNAEVATDSNQSVVTILDEGDQPVVSISNSGSVNEGDTAIFTISLSKVSTKDITVRIDTSDGTALVGDDYHALASAEQVVVIPAGTLAVDVEVRTIDDALHEFPEDFHMDLLSADHANIDVNQSSVTIVDNDNQPRVSIASTGDVIEGNTAVFTISLSEVSGRDVTVAVNTSDGTALVGDDYHALVSTEQTVVIPAGTLSVDVEVRTIDDALDEFPEDFHMDLLSADHANIDVNQSNVTIVDNDNQPRVSIASTGDVTEGNTAVFTISLSEVSGRDVTVTVNTSDGTALVGDDYHALVSTEQTVVIPAGTLSVDVEVRTIDDALDEFPEDFHMDLLSADHANIDVNQSSVTIVDNDNQPRVSIASTGDVTEGNTAVFTISLSEVSGRDVTVTVNTSDGTALVGDDYHALVSTEQTVVIPAGTLSVDVEVRTIDDALDEFPEDFHMDLLSADHANIDVNQSSVTIVDNDNQPRVSIASTGDVTEGNTAVFTISLSEVSGRDVTVTVNTSDGTALVGDDYHALVSTEQTVVIPAGTLSVDVEVRTIDDALDEFPEDFHMDLLSADHADIDVSQSSVTIIDNDNQPRVSIASAGDVTEGDTAIFTISLSEISGRDVTVTVNTSDGTAFVGDDYHTLASTEQTVVIPAGTLSVDVEVRTIDDALDEFPEDFRVNLLSADYADIDVNQGVATIVDNDDVFVSISDGDPSLQAEPFNNNDSVEIKFTISLNIASKETVSVDYGTMEIEDANGDVSAISNIDFAPISGTVTFAPGEMSKEVSVVINADDFVENLEYFQVVLSNSVNASIDDFSGVGTIKDRSIRESDNSDNEIFGSDGDNALIGDSGGTILVEHDPEINVVYVLDTSGSMRTANRLEILKTAVNELNEELLNLVDEGVTVNVSIIDFDFPDNTTTHQTITLTNDTLDNLNDIIDSLRANGATSYTEALFQTQEVISQIPTGDNISTMVLFVSDGDPIGERNPRFDNMPEVQGSSEPETYLNIMQSQQQVLVSQFWPFLLSADITTRAIGVGNNINSTNLDFIDNEDAIIVPDTQTAENLGDIIEDVVLSSIEDAPLGVDTIYGGDGDDVIFGDALISPLNPDYAFDEIVAAEFNGDRSELLEFLLDPTNNYANAQSYANSERGEADVIYGDGGDDIIFGQGGDDEIHGGLGDDYISGGAGVDTIYGDAGDDTILFEGTANGIDIIDGGADTDTLKFDVAGETLDLTLSDYDNKFSNLEMIDLGENSNTLVIDPDDVLEMSGNNQIIVDGNFSDTVQGSNWTDEGTTVIMGTTYHEYSAVSGATSVTLLVDNQINQVF